LCGLVLCVALFGCERWTLDKQMEELCAKDGGIKVYETVTLPASDFSNVGQPLARYERNAKSREEIFGPDYRYLAEEKYIVGDRQTKVEHGAGTLARTRTSIYRRADNKLLGERIFYQRGGGDGFVWGRLGLHPSGNNCPMSTTGVDLEIFIKGE